MTKIFLEEWQAALKATSVKGYLDRIMEDYRDGMIKVVYHIPLNNAKKKYDEFVLMVNPKKHPSKEIEAHVAEVKKQLDKENG